MKQAKLSFASKRTSSAPSGKAATVKRPSRASSRSTTPAVLVLSDDEGPSSEDQPDAKPIVKKRRLGPRNDRSREEEPPCPAEEKEPLNVSDKRWLKLYGNAREKMGNIEPGKYSSSYLRQREAGADGCISPRQRTIYD